MKGHIPPSPGAGPRKTTPVALGIRGIGPVLGENSVRGLPCRKLRMGRAASRQEHGLFGHSVVEAHVIDLQGEGTLLASTAKEQAGQACAV